MPHFKLGKRLFITPFLTDTLLIVTQGREAAQGRKKTLKI
jgi:hypothetical protein